MAAKALSLVGFVLVAFIVLQETPTVYAANDWSQPCFSGTCSYDIPDATTGHSGSLKIFGAQNAIGDITPAGGWEIVSCDSDSMAQDITIVCQTSDDSGACAHLFSGPSGSSSSAASPAASAAGTSGSALPSDGTEQGAVGKIVRLPEDCGKPAFARIAKAWIPTNQTIPPSVAKRLVRRDGETPVVMAFSVDVDFNSTEPMHGPVGFALVGATVPGAAAIGDKFLSSVGESNSTQARRSSHEERQFGIPDFISGALGSIGALDTFSVSQSITIPPFDIDQSFTLFNQEIQCTVQFPVTGLDPVVGALGKLDIDVDAKAHAQITLGVAASGFIIPPVVTGFGLTSGINLDINNSTITVKAGVGGLIGTGKIPAVSVGLEELIFPGIMSIGPTFELLAQVTGELDLDFGLVIGIDYHLENAHFVFPGGPVGGTFLGGDTPISLALQPSGSATPKIQGSLTPTIIYTIDAFGVLGASVMANIAASASAMITVDATLPQQNVTITPRSEATAAAVLAASTERGTIVLGRDTNGPSVTNPLNGITFSGCAEVDVGLSVNVGASATFGGLFNPGILLPLFSETVPLFEQCFGDDPPATRRSSDSEEFITILEERQSTMLKCNDPDILGTPIIMAHNEVIPLQL